MSEREEKKKLSQEEIWGKIAPAWKEARQRPMKEVIEFLSGKKGNILDLACGSGRHFVRIKGALYGVDFSSEMLRHAEESAKEKDLKVILKKASAEKLPFEDNFFDSAIYIAGLHCIDSKKNRESSLRELFRVLKKGAQALISVWSRNNERVKNRPKEPMIPWTVEGRKYERYYYIYDKAELEILFRQAGFKIIKSWEDENIWLIVEKP